MYQFGDTIAAVSSPTCDKRVIIRISGPETIDACRCVFRPEVSAGGCGVITGWVEVDSELSVEGKLYVFFGPRSYTGETVAEIHLDSNSSVTEALMGRLFGEGIRLAEPGEFTARAYLNGKIDLAQAEAVNEIITSSNKFQLAAAEKLLAGWLGEITAKICFELMESVSLIEAGLDFSGEDIEFITREGAIERLSAIRERLGELLAGSINYERVIDLPAVGIAGAANAGKSSLLNRLLGESRSIVSEQLKTTRDVLTGLLELRHCNCVLFDCAGLMQRPQGILDELAQQAAVESLRKSLVVIFCVDVSKEDWSEDVAIRGLIEPEILIRVATKSDLMSKERLTSRLAELMDLFGGEFLVTSAKDGSGIERLGEAIDKRIVDVQGGGGASAGGQNGVALTVRHRQVVTEAIGSIEGAISEMVSGEEEVVAMLLRAAYQGLSNIERADVDERILKRIFSRFCIGK